jgi:hypothetical protein
MALVARRAVRLSVRRHFRSDGRRAVKAFNDFQWQNATVAKSENACSNGQLVSVSLNVNQHVLDPFTKPGTPLLRTSTRTHTYLHGADVYYSCFGDGMMSTLMLKFFSRRPVCTAEAL